MTKLLLIGFGGFLGAIARYWLSGLAHRITHISMFPIGTFTVNILGCLIIGFLASLVETHNMFSPNMRIFLMIGILGAFTTFSTFSLETFQLIRDSQFILAGFNVILQVVIGFLAVWGGWLAGQWM